MDLFTGSDDAGSRRARPRPPKRRGSKENWFPTEPLMAAKKYARDLCEAKMSLGKAKSIAAREAVAAVHRMLPEFKQVWAEANGVPWKGDEWFASRIDHQSSGSDNKSSHLRLEQIVDDIVTASNGDVYTWRRWDELIQKGVDTDVASTWWLYIIPIVAVDSGKQLMKIGITTNLENRHREYMSRCPRALLYDTVMQPAKWYLATIELGSVTRMDAELSERLVLAAVGAGRPPFIGREWYDVSPMVAITRACGPDWAVNEPLLKDIL